ncbi:DUF4251 domain-containing protein [Flammeovirga kamogawensis]|uniref:DUF4251 domain-containing protein n=1 Tax=Flammeovirga kamogawensis TaxID=373891 RepID=A0ABX8H120_9BACT|nr:DUF4251 domain-containing protein [Flammeovirga kamogawensis]MBB6459536.1 ATPase subunit of ABC transporter with duplicated ATPase domains [Flammeovirga kamogawensis]QWG09087.1 DUF4251 domain-containing protein [Flammeovirga kamogawensis]TRX67375.1 DUF4251 domain-containing protein [Flammeovirga kamogawensis]
MKHNLFKIFVFTLLIAFAGQVNAQDEQEKPLTEKEQRKLAKKKAKEERKKAKQLAKQQAKAEETARFEMSKQAMKDQKFVLQANQVYDRYGNVAQVTNSINFIKLNGDVCVVQLGFEGIVGYNGVGGITLDGKITDLELKENEHGGVNMSFNVQGSMMQAAVRINLNGADNWADASVRSQTENIEVKFRGNLLPTDLSSVFQGATPY